MLKYTLVVIAFFVVTLGAFAQKKQKENITGIVKTVDGKPAEYISVSLKNTVYGATSDEDGRFEFHAPAGEYTLVLYSISAHKKEYPVSIKEGVVNNFDDFTIIENKNQLEEIIVTGQFTPQSLKNSLYKVKVINSQEIQQKAATDMQSLLNTEIGIRVSNDMALGESNFELMGMSGNNVKVLLDGVPLIDRGATKQSLSQIDINTIEQIEIVEGPMSVIYGTDALAGVINIITKKAKVSAEKDTYSVSARIQEESVGDEYQFLSNKGTHNENINLGWASKTGLFANAGYTRNVTDGWVGDKTGRERQWPGKDQYYYDATVGFKERDLNVWYRFNYLDETIHNKQNPLDATPTWNVDQNFKTDRYTHSFQTDYKLNNRLGFNLVSSYQDYKRKTSTIVSDYTTGEKWLSSDDAAQDISKFQAAFVRATAAWMTTPTISLQPGIEYSWDKGSGGRIDGERTISTFATFLSAEWKPLQWLSLRPGVRAILSADYDAPFAIPSISSKASIGDHMDVRLSYARGFRAPTLQELYFSFHNASHNIDGNPNLKAEYSNNFTGSFTWRLLHGGDVRITSTLSAFYNSFKDRITTAVDVNDASHTTYYNIDKYKTVGGTIENSVVWKNLQAGLNFALVGRYNSLKDNENFKGEDLPQFHYSPELSANVSYQIVKTGTSLNLYYKFTGKRKEYYYDSDTKDLYLGEFKSYNTGDFTVNQHLGRYLVLNAGIKNIFDVTTVTNTSGGGAHASGEGASLIGAGRSYFVGLNFLLNK